MPAGLTDAYIPHTMSKNPHVYVVGGGFAGLQAVGALLRRAPTARITLIDKNDYATMLPALPDVLSGRVRSAAITRRFADIVDSDRVEVIRDEIVHVDAAQRVLHGSAEHYQYDYLILTSGSTPQYYGFTPENGQLHSAHSFAAVSALRDAVKDQAREHSSCDVVVVGAGYTGLEVAACLRHGMRHNSVQPQITVVEVADEILPFLKPAERQRVRDYLDAIGVTLRTGVSLQRYADGRAELSDGTAVDKAIVCWSAGMRAECSELSGNVERTRDSRLHTNEFLQLPVHPEIFVAGDAAALQKDGRFVRRAVNFAFYSGRAAGRNVAAALSAKRMHAFRPVDLGWVIPLGEISRGRILGGIPVGGRFGLRVHYLMCGIRSFGAADAVEFYKTALCLSRQPEPIES